jgi:outer membrane immunogenic protein
VKRLCLVASLLAAAALNVTAARAQEHRPFNGLYFGLHGGNSWQGATGVFDNQNATGNYTNLSGLDVNGGIVGAQLGYNAQWNWFMLGVEGDASAHVDDNSVLSPTGIQLASDSSYLASIRGRMGVVVYDWLFFGTAGVGFSETKFSETTPSLAFNGTLRQRETGAVYGGGIEWQFIHGVTVRGEYLHYNVGNTTEIPTTFTSATSGDYIRFGDIDVARAALNISLSP